MVAKLREIYPENRIYQYTRKDKVKGVQPVSFGWATTAANKADLRIKLTSSMTLLTHIIMASWKFEILESSMK